jgi:diguanylate cyclase (GGDEF)-like protein
VTFPLRKLFYPFLVPNGLLFAGAALLLSRGTLPEKVLPFLDIFPPAVLGMALLLGWRFNCSRLLHAVLLLFIVDRGLDYFAAGISGPFSTALLSAALPLNLVAVALFRERGMVNRGGAAWGTLLVAQFLGGSWLYAQQSEPALAWLNYRIVALPPQLTPALGQPALAIFVVCLLLLGVRYYLRPAALEASFFWAGATLLFGLLQRGGQPLTLYFAAAGLILLIGVIETSHFMAYRDELTGLPERRALNETIARLGGRYTVAMLDIDHFKKFNDTHGHDVGDQVLKMVAAKLATVSGGGKTFRYGGEEFSVIFPRTAVEDALPHLERLRETIAAARFIPRGKDRPKKKPKQAATAGRHTPALSVTISIGAAEKKPRLTTAAQVIKAADQALYRAKNAGRNRVCA